MPGPNAGSRLHAFAAKAVRIQGNSSTLNALHDLFELGSADQGPAGHRKAARYLEVVNGQLDLAATALNGQGVPAKLWQSALAQVANAFTPSLLAGTWSQALGSLTPQVTTSLAWIGYVLPADDAVVDSEEYASLLQEVEELSVSVNAVDMPTPMRAFLKEHLDAIRDGLRIYGLAGSRPTRNAITKLAGDIALAGDALDEASRVAPSEAKTFFKRASAAFGKTVSFVNETAKVVESVRKIGGTAVEIWPQLPGL